MITNREIFRSEIEALSSKLMQSINDKKDPQFDSLMRIEKLSITTIATNLKKERSDIKNPFKRFWTWVQDSIFLMGASRKIADLQLKAKGFADGIRAAETTKQKDRENTQKLLEQLAKLGEDGPGTLLPHGVLDNRTEKEQRREIEQLGAGEFLAQLDNAVKFARMGNPYAFVYIGKLMKTSKIDSAEAFFRKGLELSPFKEKLEDLAGKFDTEFAEVQAQQNAKRSELETAVNKCTENLLEDFDNLVNLAREGNLYAFQKIAELMQEYQVDDKKFNEKAIELQKNIQYASE